MEAAEKTTRIKTEKLTWLVIDGYKPDTLKKLQNSLIISNLPIPNLLNSKLLFVAFFIQMAGFLSHPIAIDTVIKFYIPKTPPQ